MLISNLLEFLRYLDRFLRYNRLKLFFFNSAQNSAHQYLHFFVIKKSQKINRKRYLRIFFFLWKLRSIALQIKLQIFYSSNINSAGIFQRLKVMYDRDPTNGLSEEKSWEIQFTLYSVHCTVYTVQCTEYTVYTVQYSTVLSFPVLHYSTKFWWQWAP